MPAATEPSALTPPAADAPGLAVIDPAGTIVVADTALARQFGYAPAEIVGQSIALLFPDAPWPGSVTASAAGLSDAGLVVVGELQAQRKDGSRFPADLSWNHVPTSDGWLLIMSVVDAAGRRHREDAQRARESERLAFETFIAEQSVQFSNLAREAVGPAIVRSLGAFCDHLQIERASFFRIDLEGLLFSASSYTAPGYVSEHWPLPAAEHFPWALTQLLAGQPVVFTTLDSIPSLVDQTSFRAMGSRSAAFLPLRVDGRVSGAVGFTMLSVEREWTHDVRRRLDLGAALFTQALARQQRDEAMRAAALEVETLKRQLQGPATSRRDGRNGRSGVVGQGVAVRRVLEQINQVAATDSTVLLLGETGTGKELFAAQIHDLSTRSNHAMVKVNCAAIPPTLIESELFGREKGAFTGALARQVGRFEMADHSTIFLDEIGDLPAEVQVKLLRVLEERTIERLGSPRPILVDVRIIAATHRNLEQRVSEGSFREDLYYRLNVFPIHVPPLREHVEDIPPLVWHFVEECSGALGKRVDAIDKDVMTALQQYPWPGNVRELRNVVERAMIVSTTRRLVIPTPQLSPTATRRSPKLVDVEKDHIRGVLESTGWRIRGNGGAADRLGLKPTTLETRMAKLGLRRPGDS